MSCTYMFFFKSRSRDFTTLYIIYIGMSGMCTVDSKTIRYTNKECLTIVYKLTPSIHERMRRRMSKALNGKADCACDTCGYCIVRFTRQI